MSVKIRLEGFGGAGIMETIVSACGVAQRSGAWVSINLNGVETLISPADDPRVIHRNWQKTIERGGTFCGANIVSGPLPTPAAPIEVD